jgi:hypothetical protein
MSSIHYVLVFLNAVGFRFGRLKVILHLGRVRVILLLGRVIVILHLGRVNVILPLRRVNLVLILRRRLLRVSYSIFRTHLQSI